MWCLSKSNRLKIQNYFFTAFVLVMLFGFGFIGAQTVQPGKPNELDSKFTPRQFPLFNSSSSGSSSNAGKYSNSYDAFKNVIKCNIGLLPRKIAAISFERFLAEEISIEASAGFTYGKDPIFSAIGVELASATSATNSYFDLSDLYNNSTTNGSGLYAGGSVKFHFSGFSYWNDEGTYLELGLRTVRNNLDITPLKNQYASNPYLSYSGNPEVSVRQTQYLICYGYRFATTEKIKTSHELYFGAGWRTGNFDSFSEVDDPNHPYNPNDPYTYKIIRKNGSRENFSSPIIVMGYILGFGF
jgi:hypothetical protein